MIHDPITRITGMAHILLPQSAGKKYPDMPGRHADQATFCIIQAMAELSVPKDRLKAWIAGGASMFAEASTPANGLAIGDANIKSVQHELTQANIPIIESCVGGTNGRRMTFNPPRQRWMLFSGSALS